MDPDSEFTVITVDDFCTPLFQAAADETNGASGKLHIRSGSPVSVGLFPLSLSPSLSLSRSLSFSSGKHKIVAIKKNFDFLFCFSCSEWSIC